MELNSLHWIDSMRNRNQKEEKKNSLRHLNMSLELTNRNVSIVVFHSIDYVRLVNIESHCLHFSDN